MRPDAPREEQVLVVGCADRSGRTARARIGDHQGGRRVNGEGESLSRGVSHAILDLQREGAGLDRSGRAIVVVSMQRLSSSDCWEPVADGEIE